MNRVVKMAHDQKNIRSIIFDFDGLILDTEVPVYQSWQELYQSFGATLSFSNWSKIIGTDEAEGEHFEDLEKQIGRSVDRDSLAPVRRKRELELIALQSVQAGVKDYLRDAQRRGLKIGLASSSSCAWVTGHLTNLGLIDYFECIRASDDVRKVKPDPELYLSVLEALEVEPNEAIAIEDSPHGVTAAKRAGIFCVAVPNELTRRLPLDHADLLVYSLVDLPLQALLKELEKDQGDLVERQH
jgi:HAD superfamily hydrolase (TIGR01509 family)